jgi:hypothetical protein
MATYKERLNSDFMRTIGFVVVVNFQEIDVMRSKSKKSAKESTVVQLAQQAKFAKVIDVLSPLKEVLDLYFETPEGLQSRYKLAPTLYLRQVVK